MEKLSSRRGFPIVVGLLIVASLVLFAFPWYASASAQQRGIATSQPIAPLFHRKDGKGAPPVVGTSISQDNTGDNWAGFTVGSGTGNGFKGVQANWNAPCISGNHDSQHVYSSWVGLGGHFGGPEPLEQAGIMLQTDGTYRLFWEYVTLTSDQQSIDTNDVIHCGDPILAWVHFGSSYCPNGGFYAHVQVNKTGGAHWGSNCTAESKGYGIQSGDWIDERPTLNSCGNPGYLADFNYSQWSSMLAQANYSGASWVAPSNFVNTQIIMNDFGTNQYISYPDQTILTGNSFTGRWYHAGTYCDH